jgi:hypothetical protein
MDVLRRRAAAGAGLAAGVLLAGCLAVPGPRPDPAPRAGQWCQEAAVGRLNAAGAAVRIVAQRPWRWRDQCERSAWLARRPPAEESGPSDASRAVAPASPPEPPRLTIRPLGPMRARAGP